MSDFKLTARPALSGLVYKTGDITVTEVTALALVSVAIPNGEREIVSKKLLENYYVDIPDIGKYTSSDKENMRFLGLQSDQFFALFDYIGDHAVAHLKAKVSEIAYLSDQSDSWLMLRLSAKTGEQCRRVLERICPLDLHPDSFTEASVARTAMEHLAVIIVHESDGQYLLMSPRSSAQSFLHTVTKSIENTIGRTSHD